MCSRTSNVFGWDGSADVPEKYFDVLALVPQVEKTEDETAGNGKVYTYIDKYTGQETKGPRKAKVDLEQNVYLESSDEGDGSDGAANLSRAALKALDR